MSDADIVPIRSPVLPVTNNSPAQRGHIPIPGMLFLRTIYLHANCQRNGIFSCSNPRAMLSGRHRRKISQENQQDIANRGVNWQKTALTGWRFLSRDRKNLRAMHPRIALTDGTALASSKGDLPDVLRRMALEEAFVLNRATQLCGRSAPNWRHTTDTPVLRACHPSTEPGSPDRLNEPALLDSAPPFCIPRRGRFRLS